MLSKNIITVMMLFVLSVVNASGYDRHDETTLDISEIKFEEIKSFESSQKIKVPKFLPLKALKKGRKEGAKAFLLRVRKANTKREAYSQPIQEKFRADVIKHNVTSVNAKDDFLYEQKQYNARLKKFRALIDYDSREHIGKSISNQYPHLQPKNYTFDNEKQDPNLNDPYLPLLTSYKNKKFSAKKDTLKNLIKRTKKVYKDYKSWLFVISIENYQNADPMLFANRTSDIVTEAFQKKMGIPSRHIITLKNENATGKNINYQLKKLIKRIQKGDTVYFYYVGHGTSGPSGKNYLLAYDGSVDMMSMDGVIEMKRIYNAFQRSRASRTFAFIDASFSGVSDGLAIRKGERVALPVKKTKYHKRLNIINATKRDQMVNAYFEKGYRLFSYFLVKGALSEKEQDTGEMFDTLKDEIFNVTQAYGATYEQEPEFFGYRNLAMQK